MDIKLFELIANNSDIGICVYNVDGNFIYVNPKMIQWRKISFQQYLKMNVRDFFDENTINDCVFMRVIRSHKPASHVQFYQPGSSQKPEEKRIRMVTGTPIFDQSGNVQYVITYLRDIDEFNDTVQQLIADSKQSIPTLHIRGEKTLRFNEEDHIIAESPEMCTLLRHARNIAQTDATVLLCGESGTGKEVVANYIYQNSPRAKAPFVKVNCAAFAESLLEAELFGYERGSFTGALNTGKKGLAESANGGTLFLDEVNSLPLPLQGKFLRLIEEHELRRIGSNTSIHMDFRLVAATNVDLSSMVAAGTFRADLYYRLSVVPLTIPPLRHRTADIVPLCKAFVKRMSEQYGMNKRFSDTALAQICAYEWPGNVRELRNFVERVIIMTPHEVELIEQIQNETMRQTPVNYANTRTKQKLTVEVVAAALDACGGNRERTAEYLGISRRTLQYKIQEYQLPSKPR